jgi:geranylgeranyl diphosphate synthase type II
VTPAARLDDRSLSGGDFAAYLSESRALVLDEIRRFIPEDGPFRKVLYDLILDYPMRAAKGLRPALCLSTCRALGGSTSAALPSAAVLELLHNAFLIHDDVEDASEQRRGRASLHEEHGTPAAINVGDAMLALAMSPLLDNIRHVGLGKALRVLQAVSLMSVQTAEGQALELHWVRHGVESFDDADYVRLAEKKTAVYSFVTPMAVGGILGGASPSVIERLEAVGRALGVAFQIQDDVLNLAGDEGAYGKERYGDLWEGKHTLVVAHMLRCAAPDRRERAQHILRKARPAARPAALEAVRVALDSFETDADISPRARRALHEALATQAPIAVKTEADVRFLLGEIEACGSIHHARNVSLDFAHRAAAAFESLAGDLPWSVHRQFLWSLLDFAVHRTS